MVSQDDAHHAAAGDDDRPGAGNADRPPAGDVDRPSAGDADERAATAARLAAAIAGIEQRGRPAGRSTPRPDRSARQRPDAGPETDVGPDPGRADARRAADLCLRWLAVRARSRAELAQRLAGRDIPAAVIDEVLDRLATSGLIDDAAFAAEFVRVKHRSNAWGPTALRAGLRAKGIDTALIDQALAGLDTDTQRERAAALVQSRLDAALFAGLPTARRRLLSLLARRGYPSSVSIAVVNDALRGYVEQMDDPGDD